MHPSVSADRTEELEAKLRVLAGKGPEAYPRRDWISLRESYRLPLLYPNQYVAYRDHHTGKGHSRRMALREVVFASTSLKEAQQYVDGLPDEQMVGLNIEFAAPV